MSGVSLLQTRMVSLAQYSCMYFSLCLLCTVGIKRYQPKQTGSAQPEEETNTLSIVRRQLSQKL